MTVAELISSNPVENLGREMYALIEEAFPICRSITGDGIRATLAILGKHIPLSVREVPTGTSVFDWTVPNEWNIRDAYVKNSRGERVIDFRRSNLHVLNYSVPVRCTMPLDELKNHLFSDPTKPEWIPYRTSYYKKQWGFCLSHNALGALEQGEYEICIDSTLEPGHLTYGEYYLPGETPDEVLLSTHCCHPSLCNDNLSGIALCTMLARLMTKADRRYSYRFLFIPGSIGSITWLSMNEENAQRIKHGLVVACVGDPGNMTYKRSRRGNAEIDTAVVNVLRHSGQKYHVRDFSPYGYDERQYCSPGFNLAVGSLTRTPHGQYPEYHTSADGLNLVQHEFLADSLAKYLSVINVLEANRVYINTNPKCEPQLGKRGLYASTGGRTESPINEFAMLWVLNMSDGLHSLLDIAERAELSFDTLQTAARRLVENGLLTLT